LPPPRPAHYPLAVDVAGPETDLIHRRGKFAIGQVVRHRFHPFRGVVFDVDPTFSNTEEWWLSIPKEVRPRKDQPYYHLLAENEKTTYVAYVSEQNLLPDDSGEPVRHPQVQEIFGELRDGHYELLAHLHH
jgi:heat shock protein HspQ